MQVTTEDEGVIDFQPGFDNAAQSAIVTGELFEKSYPTPVTRGRVKVCEHNHLFGEVFLTGCTPWTLYQYDWYLGDSLCLPAGQRATDTGSDFEQTLNQLHPLLEQKCKRVF